MRVFLGGTCNKTTWRSELIPMLEVDHFDPVVKDWTPADQQRELEERETCDYCLYVITPKMTGVYSIAEAVDDSNKRPEKTIFAPLQQDDKSEFDPGQWKALQAVANMVSENGGKVFLTLSQVAAYLNNKQRRSTL